MIVIFFGADDAHDEEDADDEDDNEDEDENEEDAALRAAMKAARSSSVMPPPD